MSWLEQLEEQGFAHLPALLSPEEVATLSAGFDRLLARARTLRATTDIDGTRFVVDPDPFRLHRVVWAGGCEPDIAALGGHPRFLEVARQALRSDTVVQLIQQAHFKLPGDGVRFRWHQDGSNRRYGTELFTDVNGRGSFVQVALAVDPMGPGNGGLRVVPDSHRLGFIAEPGTGQLAPEHVDDASAVAPELQPGDALVFGPFLIHGSEPNEGSHARRLFIQGYAMPGANHRKYPGSGTGVIHPTVSGLGN